MLSYGCLVCDNERHLQMPARYSNQYFTWGSLGVIDSSIKVSVWWFAVVNVLERFSHDNALYLLYDRACSFAKFHCSTILIRPFRPVSCCHSICPCHIVWFQYTCSSQPAHSTCWGSMTPYSTVQTNHQWAAAVHLLYYDINPVKGTFCQLLEELVNKNNLNHKWFHILWWRISHSSYSPIDFLKSCCFIKVWPH